MLRGCAANDHTNARHRPLWLRRCGARRGENCSEPVHQRAAVHHSI